MLSGRGLTILMNNETFLTKNALLRNVKNVSFRGRTVKSLPDLSKCFQCLNGSFINSVTQFIRMGHAIGGHLPMSKYSFEKQKG